jgi:hypothetical protein
MNNLCIQLPPMECLENVREKVFFIGPLTLLMRFCKRGLRRPRASGAEKLDLSVSSRGPDITPFSIGPDMKPPLLSNGPEAKPLSKGPDIKPFKGPEPRGTGCKGIAANEAVPSNDAAGSKKSPANNALWLPPVLAVETLALTEAPEIVLNVVSGKFLLCLCKPEELECSMLSCLKEPLKVSESRVLESTVNLSEFDGLIAGDSNIVGLT